MPYATAADMLTRYGTTELRQLTDIETPRTGGIVATVLQRALDDAAAWIDSFLIGRYTLPLVHPQALAALNLVCAAEARYLLMTTSADERAVADHKSRETYLRSVAKGEISLLPAAAVAEPEGAGAVLFNPGSKVFGRESAGLGSD